MPALQILRGLPAVLAALMTQGACASGSGGLVPDLDTGSEPRGEPASAAQSTGGACVDECPAEKGYVAHGCKARFMYGVNYAWLSYAGDFGGISAWNEPGVLAAKSDHLQNLKKMRAYGASVVRWWLVPDLRGDGVELDASGTPTGPGGSFLDDVEMALELAERADVYLMLTWFSFDGFRPDAQEGMLQIPSLRPLVVEASKRAALLERVVEPVAALVEEHPLRHRMVAWDLMNEPELAVSGASLDGDPDFQPLGGRDGLEVDPVDHAQMKTFLEELATSLRKVSSAQITLGQQSLEWRNSFRDLDVDFYQFHVYGWQYLNFPTTVPPSTYGLDDKPVIIGEFPADPSSSLRVSYDEFVSDLYEQGYSGSLAWHFDQMNDEELTDLKAFADTYDCVTAY